MFFKPSKKFNLLFFLLFQLFSCSHKQEPFNEEKWARVIEKRYELTDDLINSKVLIGKSKSEVKKILGNNPYQDERNKTYYYIGEMPDDMAPGGEPLMLLIEYKKNKVALTSYNRGYKLPEQ